ncbi:MAG TPA: RsmB/NOP family class I SAM-dependent RNA methyltransferase [Macromonas sp.]|nr:RsmB/NOP family class I SAM-dependent RNA methyltransferase [Macromonas sp.]
MHPKALLDACADLIAQVLSFEHPADATVAAYFREHRQLGQRERQLLSDTVYTVLREQPRLAWCARSHPGWAEASASGKAAKPPQPFKPARGGSLPAYLARTYAVLAFKGDASVLDAALSEPERAWLAQCQTLPAEAAPGAPPECHHLLPAWLAERLQAQWGAADFAALAAALNEAAPLDLRVNPLKAKRPAVLQQLAEAGLAAAPTPYAPQGIRLQGKPSLHKLPLYNEGAIEVQDEGSQLLCLLLEPKRNELVVDFCAGAGGKTLALGAAMRNTGRLYAFDTSAHRLEALQPRLQRSGLSNVHPMAIAHERDERIKRLVSKADRVLVDAPCSGLGTLRRSPDLKWRQSAQAVAAVAELQGRILASAARLVKPGGRLVYATCSLLREENEVVAQAFADAHRGFRLLPAEELLRRAGVEQAEALCDAGYLRLWPHLHGTDGFFAAVWQKCA